MRWPWSGREADEPAATDRPAGAEQPAAVERAAPVEAPPSPMGWAFLPPIQRSLDTPIAPVTRPTSFPAELPAWRSPSFTGTLSHAVVDTAPGGVIDGDGAGLGTPTHTAGPEPELTLLPPPRPTPVQRSVVADPVPAPHPAPHPPGAVVPVEPAEEVPRAVDEPDGSDVVRPEPPAAELTRAPSVGMPLVQRSVVADAPPPPPAESPDPTPDAEETRAPDRVAVELGPADVPVLVTRSQETAPPAVVQRSAIPAPEPPMPATSPRLGLGAPLGKAPETAVPVPMPAPPRAPTAEATPRPAALEEIADAGFTEVPIQRSPAPVAPATPGPAPSTAPVQPPAEPPVPPLTLARSVDSGNAPAPTPTPPDPTDEPATPALSTIDVVEQGAVPDEPTVEHADEAIEPTEPVTADPPSPVEPPTRLPSAPLPLSGGIATSIQRADVLPGAGTPTPSLAVRPAPLVPVQRSRERVIPIQRLHSEPPTVESARLTPATAPSRRDIRPADSAIAPQPVAVQRSTASHPLTTDAPSQPPGDAGSGRPASDLQDASPAPVTSIQPPPARGPVVSRAVELVAPTAVRARALRPTTPAAAPAPQQADLPLAAPPVPPTESITVQTAPDDEPAPPEPAAPGPAAAAAPSPASVPASGPVTVQTAAAPPAAGGGAGGASGASATGDVDALAQKLFPAMLRRIKSELLLDRERRGVRTDPW